MQAIEALQQIAASPDSLRAHAVFFDVVMQVGKVVGVGGVAAVLAKWFEISGKGNTYEAVDRLSTCSSGNSLILRFAAGCMAVSGFQNEAVRAYSYSCRDLDAGGDGRPAISALEEKFSEIAKGYDENSIHRTTANQFTTYLGQVIGFRPGMRALDVGCGTGLVGEWLKPKVAWLEGVDLSNEMIDQARAKGIFDTLSVEEATAALARSERGAQYDLILCSFCLFYFIDLTSFFEGIARTLRSGGQFVGTVYPCWDDCDVMRKETTLEYAHSRGYLRRMAQEHGLTTERIDLRHFCTSCGFYAVFSKA
jgi:ubiquinone/menaquinone biosynthesis C-methylase UbiE